MIKNIIILLIIALNSLDAQVTQEWVAKYKDSTTGTVYPASVSVDNLGFIYVSGRCNAFNRSRYITFKYSNSGNLQWYRIYESPYIFTFGDADVVLKNVVDKDNNIYVTGYSYNDSNTDIVTIKYSSAGDSIWVKRYNGLADGFDFPRDMVVDRYSNVYITAISRGSSSDDYLTLKYDSTGNLLWNEVYVNGDVPNAMAIDSSGNVYVTGQSSSFFTTYLTVKYNNSGVLQWVRTHGSARDAEGKSIAADLNGNIYVTGFITLSNGNSNYSTLKYDTSGNLIWNRNFERESSARPNKILVDLSGNCYVTGLSAILKYDSSGGLLWIDTSKYFNNVYSSIDKSGYLYLVKLFPLNTLFFIYTVKYGNLGNILWEKIYGEGVVNDYNEPFGISIDYYSNIFITGIKYLNGIQNTDTILTIKYSQLTSIVHANQDINNTFELLQNYPNPFNPITVISYQLAVSNIVLIKVYDVLGNKIKTLVNKKQNSGSYKIEFDGSNLPSGIYFYKIESGNFVSTKKMMLIK